MTLSKNTISNIMAKKKTTANENNLPENPTIVEEETVQPVVEETLNEVSPEPEPTPKLETNKSEVEPKQETTKSVKSVPTIAELRILRRHNESIFTFNDGFRCVATSQRVADSLHEEWLKD